MLLAMAEAALLFPHSVDTWLAPPKTPMIHAAPARRWPRRRGRNTVPCRSAHTPHNRIQNNAKQSRGEGSGWSGPGLLSTHAAEGISAMRHHRVKPLIHVRRCRPQFLCEQKTGKRRCCRNVALVNFPTATGDPIPLVRRGLQPATPAFRRGSVGPQGYRDR